MEPNVRFGSLADLLLNISLMSASGGKADIVIKQHEWASAPWATAWNTPGDNMGGRACPVFSFIVLAPVYKLRGENWCLGRGRRVHEVQGSMIFLKSFIFACVRRSAPGFMYLYIFIKNLRLPRPPRPTQCLCGLQRPRIPAPIVDLPGPKWRFSGCTAKQEKPHSAF